MQTENAKLNTVIVILFDITKFSSDDDIKKKWLIDCLLCL